MTTSPLPGAIRLPDGCWIRGRGLRAATPAGPAPSYGLYLGTSRMRQRHDSALTWGHHWIDWPDFLVPREREQAVARICQLRAVVQSGEAAEVACGGGVGRTGTVIACLAALTGLPAREAIAWTRANYHERAVETPWQRAWVARFPGCPARGRQSAVN
jgi:hypothetical protein